MTIQKGMQAIAESGPPSEPAQAERFEKARSARASAVLEGYVELIDDLLTSQDEARPIDIARRLGVSHATAIKSIARLKREGSATSKHYREVFLAPRGQSLATKVRASPGLSSISSLPSASRATAPNSMRKTSNILCQTTR